MKNELEALQTKAIDEGQVLLQNKSREPIGINGKVLFPNDLVAVPNVSVIRRVWPSVVTGMLMVSVMFGGGCASLATNAYYTKQKSIEVRATNGGASVGVDVFSLGAVAEHPVASVGAALGDAVIIGLINKAGNNNDWWNGFYGIELAGGSDEDARPEGALVIQGNGNYVNWNSGHQDHLGVGENMFNVAGE